MNIVKHNPWGTGLVTANQYQQGLGFRLFGKSIGGWFKKALKGVVSAAKTWVSWTMPKVIADEIIGGLLEPAEEAIDSWKLNGVFTTDKLPGSGDIPVTAAEEQILDQWLQTKWFPFLKNLTDETGAALKLQNPQTFLIALNAIENKINIVQDHYSVADNAGLSQNAIDQRNGLITESLRIIHEAIKAGIVASGLQVTTMPVQFQASAYNLMPLFASTILTTVQGENYKLAAGSGTIPVKTLPVSTKPGTINTGTNPGTGKGGTQVTPISSGGNTTNTGTITVTDNKGKEVQQQEQPAPAKKFNYWPWLAAAALAGGVIAVSKGRKKGGRPAKSKK